MIYWLHARYCLIALIALLILFSPTACLAITSSWTSVTSGNWGSAVRWMPAVVPNNGSPTGDSRYDAIIAAMGAPYTVTLNSSVTVDSLTLDSANATIDHTSGTLTLTDDLVLNAGTYQFNGGTIRGGRISGSGGQITFQPQGTFDAVTVDRDLTFSTGNFADAWIDIRNGLTLANNRIISLTGGAIQLRACRSANSGESNAQRKRCHPRYRAGKQSHFFRRRDGDRRAEHHARSGRKQRIVDRQFEQRIRE